MWIRLHQGFDSQVPLTGEPSEKPSLLVVDNVFVDSTPTKVEKLRDLVAYYDDRPVIIIVSTPGSPLSLSEKFNIPVKYGVLLKDNRITVKEEEI
jgi:hypothetical protein